MGLDMYLAARKNTGDWNFYKPADKKFYHDILNAAGIPNLKCEGAPSLHISATVAYWRKANQIHKWFVETAQEGKDDCGEYYVSREQLADLVKQCREAIANKDKAGEILPPQSGCFFGSTRVDEEYFTDLKSTAENIEAILNNPELATWAFYYHSSW